MTTYGPWQEYAPGSDVEDFQRGQQIGSGLVEAHEQVTQSRLQQQAMEQQIKQAALSYQTQQRRQEYIQSRIPQVGIDQATKEGLMIFGPAGTGFTGAGAASLFRAPPTTTIVPPGTTGTFPGHAIVGHGAASVPNGAAPSPNSAAPVPQIISIPGAAPRAYTPPSTAGAAVPITDENGNVIAHSFNGKLMPAPRATTQAKFSPVDQNMLNDISANERIIEAQLAKGDLSEANSIKARNTLADFKKQKQAIYAKYQSAAAQPPTASESDKITYPAPPSIQPTAPATVPGANADDPLGLFTK